MHDTLVNLLSSAQGAYSKGCPEFCLSYDEFDFEDPGVGCNSCEKSSSCKTAILLDTIICKTDDILSEESV